jgi:hypothetical protein
MDEIIYVKREGTAWRIRRGRDWMGFGSSQPQAAAEALDWVRTLFPNSMIALVGPDRLGEQAG